MNESSLPQIQPITNPKIKDMTGIRIGRLVVIGYLGPRPKQASWLCRCDCGNHTVVLGHNLRCSTTTSCGCLRVEGKYQVSCRGPEYKTWVNMRTRCNNPKSSQFLDYGGRGIEICERWRKFENFYADMGPRPASEYSLDRINVDGNYEPSNCRWATKEEQANNARSNIPLTYSDKTMNLAQWAREIAINEKTLYDRINKLGWSVERALTEPVNINKRNRRQ